MPCALHPPAQVACANANRPDSNGSQFFLTLDRADHCDRKYTIFGKVTGALRTLCTVCAACCAELQEGQRAARGRTHCAVLCCAPLWWGSRQLRWAAAASAGGPVSPPGLLLAPERMAS